MKKIILLFLAVTLVISSVSGCMGGQGEATPVPAVSGTPATNTSDNSDVDGEGGDMLEYAAGYKFRLLGFIRRCTSHTTA